jgi:hypothetical protein
MCKRMCMNYFWKTICVIWGYLKGEGGGCEYVAEKVRIYLVLPN